MDAGLDGALPADGGDTGPDGGSDAGPCGMACPSERPVCDETSGMCVQCTAADASACTDDTAFCDTATSQCVACLGDGDCTEADAARCEAGSCVACNHNAQCSSVPGDPGLCSSAGTCVQCTSMEETPCSGNSCDPSTNTCTTTPLGMTPTCGACVADSECMADHRCVPMTFGGISNGAYCMKIASTGCAQPFLSPLNDRESLSGEAATTYCGIDESTVSCAAVRALLTSQLCPGGTDGECGADGALCRMVGLANNRCTYACSTVDECPSTGPSATCAGHCGGS